MLSPMPSTGAIAGDAARSLHVNLPLEPVPSSDLVHPGGPPEEHQLLELMEAGGPACCHAALLLGKGVTFAPMTGKELTVTLQIDFQWVLSNTKTFGAALLDDLSNAMKLDVNMLQLSGIFPDREADHTRAVVVIHGQVNLTALETAHATGLVQQLKFPFVNHVAKRSVPSSTSPQAARGSPNCKSHKSMMYKTSSPELGARAGDDVGTGPSQQRTSVLIARHRMAAEDTLRRSAKCSRFNASAKCHAGDEREGREDESPDAAFFRQYISVFRQMLDTLPRRLALIMMQQVTNDFKEWHLEWQPLALPSRIILGLSLFLALLFVLPSDWKDSSMVHEDVRHWYAVCLGIITVALCASMQALFCARWQKDRASFLLQNSATFVIFMYSVLCLLSHSITPDPGFEQSEPWFGLLSAIAMNFVTLLDAVDCSWLMHITCFFMTTMLVFSNLMNATFFNQEMIMFKIGEVEFGKANLQRACYFGFLMMALPGAIACYYDRGRERILYFATAPLSKRRLDRYANQNKDPNGQSFEEIVGKFEQIIRSSEKKCDKPQLNTLARAIHAYQDDSFGCFETRQHEIFQIAIHGDRQPSLGSRRKSSIMADRRFDTSISRLSKWLLFTFCVYFLLTVIMGLVAENSLAFSVCSWILVTNVVLMLGLFAAFCRRYLDKERWSMEMKSVICWQIAAYTVVVTVTKLQRDIMLNDGFGAVPPHTHAHTAVFLLTLNMLIIMDASECSWYMTVASFAMLITVTVAGAFMYTFIYPPAPLFPAAQAWVWALLQMKVTTPLSSNSVIASSFIQILFITLDSLLACVYDKNYSMLYLCRLNVSMQEVRANIAQMRKMQVTSLETRHNAAQLLQDAVRSWRAKRQDLIGDLDSAIDLFGVLDTQSTLSRRAKPRKSAGDRVLQAQAAFAAYDSDASGAIDLQELRALLDDWGFPGLDSEVFLKHDSSGDGFFQFDEFVNIINELLDPESQITWNVAL